MNLGQDQNYIHPTAHLIQYKNSDSRFLVFNSCIPIVPPSRVTQLYTISDIIFNIKVGIIKKEPGAEQVAKDIANFLAFDREDQILKLKRSYSNEF